MLQVELLMAYISSDPRATVRAVALECLSKLALQAARSAVFHEKDFAVLYSVIEDIAAAPAVLALAYQVIKKVCVFFLFQVTHITSRLWGFPGCKDFINTRQGPIHSVSRKLQTQLSPLVFVPFQNPTALTLPCC